MHAFQLPTGAAFTNLSETVEELENDLSRVPMRPSYPSRWKTGDCRSDRHASPPLPVQVVETSKANPFELVQVIIAPLFGPLGTAALGLLLVIFMLLQREDLRAGSSG